MLSSARWLLASGSGLPDWANYGALGLMVTAFLSGLIVPGFLWKQERKRAEDAELRERELRVRIEDKMLPLIGDATRTVTEAMVIFREGRK